MFLSYSRYPSVCWKTHFVPDILTPPTPSAPAVKPDRHHHVVRSEDGRLFYDNQWYCRGQAICINKKDDYPTRWVSESALHHKGAQQAPFLPVSLGLLSTWILNQG